MPPPAIDIQNLHKIYEPRGKPAVRALAGISLTVPQGQIFGLLGPNGAGKTTTLKILTTLQRPTSGTAHVSGFDVVTQPLEVRKQICVVLQDDAVDQYLTVQDNLRTYGRFHLLDRKAVEQRADRVTELFGLREYRRSQAIDLSGGLRRRLQVAKVFMVDKPVVFLDEATTGMDTLNKRTTMQAIREEAGRGRTIVLTTHVLEEAEELCDAVAIIDRGVVVAEESVEMVKSMGLRFVHVSLLFEKIGPATLRLVKKLNPVKMQVKNNAIELTLRDRAGVLNALGTLRRARDLVSFEASGATLEDVFVDLLQQRGKEKP
jgi:ABC-2 type transport system ATP-binding protein